MIESYKYFPQQMNGPVISALGASMDSELEPAEAVLDYLYNLSINTADETELENIGRLIGYPRPVVPEGFDQENIFLLGPIPIEIDPEIGLSMINSEIGGQLSSVEVSTTNFMGLGMYRNILKKIAILKRYGVTLNSIDQIARAFSDDYTISFDENNDIRLAFTDSIGYKNVWLLTKLFYRVSTVPQVYVSSGN